MYYYTYVFDWQSSEFFFSLDMCPASIKVYLITWLIRFSTYIFIRLLKMTFNFYYRQSFPSHDLKDSELRCEGRVSDQIWVSFTLAIHTVSICTKTHNVITLILHVNLLDWQNFNCFKISVCMFQIWWLHLWRILTNNLTCYNRWDRNLDTCYRC